MDIRPSTSNDGYFQNASLTADLKGRSLRGGIVTLAGNATRLVIHLAGLAALGRLLVPEDFGLFAMVMAFTGFVSVFKDAGLSVATVQRKHVSEAQISTLFWFNLLIGVVLMIATALLAPVATWFYGREELTPITLAIALSYLLSGLGMQHQALLRRQMRFTALAIIEVLAPAAALVVAVAVAFCGAGYWALVLQLLTTAGVLTILYWHFCEWRPGLPRRGTGVRAMLAFGMNLTGADLMNYLARNLDNILIGKLIGASALGLYSRAYGLLMMPIRQISAPVTQVAIPALSSLQDESEKFRRYYLRGLSLVAFLGFPLIVWLFVSADAIIYIILGEQWMECVPIFRLLAPAALVGVTNFVNAWVLIPLGQTNRLVRINVFAGALNMLSMVIGIQWGLEGVAIAISISHVGLKTLQVWYAYRFSPLRVSDFFAAISYPLVAALLAGIGALALVQWVGEDLESMRILKFAFSGIAMIVIYLGVFLCSPLGRGSLVAIKRDLKAAWMSAKTQRSHTDSEGAVDV